MFERYGKKNDDTIMFPIRPQEGNYEVITGTKFIVLYINFIGSLMPYYKLILEKIGMQKYVGFNVFEKEGKKIVKIEDIKKYKKMMILMKDVNYGDLYGYYYIKNNNRWYVDLHEFFKQLYNKSYDEYKCKFKKYIEKIKKKIFKNQFKQEDDGDTLVTFGKYKGKKFKDILKDSGYYGFILELSLTKNQCVKKLQEYLKKNPQPIPKDMCNCVYLSKFLKCNVEVLKLIDNLIINENEIYDISVSEVNIPANTYGQFLDYYMRYEICKNKNMIFFDSRTEFILNNYSNWIYENLISRCEKCGLLSVYFENLIKMDENTKKIIFDDIEDNKITYISKKTHFFDENESECNEIEIKEEKIVIDENIIKNIRYRVNSFNEINSSYIKMKNKNAINKDILNVSISHSIFFNEMDNIEFINYENEIMTEYFENKLNEYLVSKTKNVDVENILLNPILGNEILKIKADADLIINNNVIDIKASKRSIGSDKKDFIQLIIYSILYFVNYNNKIKKLIIFNPLNGIEYVVNIENWNKEFELFKYLLEKRCE
jgi:hypothetical protein